jgi:hypothetical protein
MQPPAALALLHPCLQACDKVDHTVHSTDHVSADVNCMSDNDSTCRSPLQAQVVVKMYAQYCSLPASFQNMQRLVLFILSLQY